VIANEPASAGKEGTNNVKTPKDRAEERRREKLDAIRQQVDSGELTVRKMTKKERDANPPSKGRPKRRP
jgi:hypothetical protein